MKRRFFNSAVVTATAWLSTSAAWAQAALFKSGKDFLTLDRPVATEAGTGKVEVIEFFWYSCPHCNAFEPSLEAWSKKLPADVVLTRVPAAFRDDMVPQQRLFYTLEALGEVERLHRKCFDTIHGEKRDLLKEADMIEWAAHNGVDKAKFADTYKSFGVVSKVKRAVQLQNDFKIEGVPSLGVAGRFYTDGTLAGSMDRALQVTDSLLALVRQGRA